MKKTCVLLLQLGTPDSPKVKDVRRYLSEFLNDPRVIDLPWLLRKVLVNGIIVPFRSPKSAKIYKTLWELGKGESPLLTHTQALIKILESDKDSENITFEFAMRYQNPSMDDVFQKIQKSNYDRLVIFPLFPHYASASSGSAIEKTMKIISKWWVIPEIKIVSQFYNDPFYIESIVSKAKIHNIEEYDHVLFSYHGLPERQVDKVYEDLNICKDHLCDTTIDDNNKFCYKATCYATTRLLVEKLGLSESKYTVCFQSRLDKKWLEPFTDKEIEKLAKNGAKKILVFSPAFVADCLETLVEIGIEYQELFEKHGGEKIQLVESNNTDPIFVEAIKNQLKLIGI